MLKEDVAQRKAQRLSVLIGGLLLALLLALGCADAATGPLPPCEWQMVRMRDSTGAYTDSIEICIQTDW